MPFHTPNIPVASVAPADDVDRTEAEDAVCVMGTVLVDQHAKDLETVHSLLSRRVPLVISGRPHARISAHIADGTWSSVYLAFQDESKMFAALKVIPVGAANAHSYHAEVETLRSLQHPNVVQYYGHFVRRINGVKCLCIELEYCGKQTLLSHLQAKRPRHQMTANDIVSFATQLASALEYIHAQGQLHGDLRPENILITPENQLKLSSFGSPLWIERYGRVPRTVSGGDRVYAPPEWAASMVPHRRLQLCETPLPSYDMWSLGCVVSELVTLKLLRQDRCCTSSVANEPGMLSGILNEVAAAHCGLFAPLCSGLLALEATQRLTAGEACCMLQSLSNECPTAPKSPLQWLSSIRRRSRPDSQAAATSA